MPSVFGILRVVMSRSYRLVGLDTSGSRETWLGLVLVDDINRDGHDWYVQVTDASTGCVTSRNVDGRVVKSWTGMSSARHSSTPERLGLHLGQGRGSIDIRRRRRNVQVTKYKSWTGKSWTYRHWRLDAIGMSRDLDALCANVWILDAHPES